MENKGVKFFNESRISVLSVHIILLLYNTQSHVFYFLIFYGFRTTLRTTCRLHNSVIHAYRLKLIKRFIKIQNYSITSLGL